MAKKEELDEETLALIQWCIEVEGFLVAGGATVKQAQDHIEEQVEWFTDQFYDGLTPEEAAAISIRCASRSDSVETVAVGSILRPSFSKCAVSQAAAPRRLGRFDSGSSSSTASSTVRDGASAGTW